jgi:hypothetical protein
VCRRPEIARIESRFRVPILAAVELTQAQRALLETLANAIIPADQRDNGAKCVEAARRIAEKIEATNAKVYFDGLELAERLSRESFGCEPSAVTALQAHELLAKVRDRNAAFFKQLRMDVSALYLSDPTVWARIGFPGPSTERGGYPDFDQPQGKSEK